MIFPKTNIKREEENGNDLKLRQSPYIRAAGIITLVIGLWLSVSCYLDYLNGNETASVGMALGFLIFLGFPGILIVLFSFRRVAVKGEDVVFRDCLLRRRHYGLDEITGIIWSDVHPCPEKRRFVVRSGNCSLRYGGKIKIEGAKLLFYRRFQKVVCCTVSELTEVSIKEREEGRIIISIFHQKHRLLFKINDSVHNYEDFHFTFALVRHLKELGVPVKCMESVGEHIDYMMRKRFIHPEDAERVLKEEVERTLPTIRKYEKDLEKSGYQLLYGAADSAGMEKQVKALFPEQMADSGFVFGYYICLTKEGRLVCDKNQRYPLCQCSVVMIRAPDNPKGRNTYYEDLKDLIYVEGIAESAVRYTLEHFYMEVKKKRVYLSEYRHIF